jgi:endonuclease/exonuclease/phosphatase family metal-dependent hydrolase
MSDLPLRLLTFNTLFRGETRHRLRAIGGLLDRSPLDVACLQEVVARRNLALLRASTPSFTHAAWTPYGPLVRGGLVTLSRRPIRRQRSVVYRVRGGRHLRSLSDSFIRKGVLVTELDVGGEPVVVVNTHLLANYDDDWSPGNRYAIDERAELRQLAEVVGEIDPGLPLVVVGDLNVPAGSWLLDELLAATGLQDALAGRPEPTFRFAPVAIDHVLARPAGPRNVAVEARIVYREELAELPRGRTVHLSDHFGIEATIAWSRSKDLSN